MKTTSKTHLHSNNLSRRLFLASSVAAAALPLSTTGAFATSKSQAEALIVQVVAEVQNIINSGRSEASIIKSFENLFANHAHVTTISRSVLGPAWKTASDGDKSAYVAAFKGYLARKYGKQFRSFEGASIDVIKSTDYGKKGLIVESRVSSPKWAPVTVEWHVVEKGGLKFFDLIVEGVKLISTERAEIRAVLDKNGGSVGKLASALNGMG